MKILPQSDLSNELSGYIKHEVRKYSQIIVFSGTSLFLLAVIKLMVVTSYVPLDVKYAVWADSLMYVLAVLTLAALFLRFTTPFIQNTFLKLFPSREQQMILKSWGYLVWGLAVLIILAKFTDNFATLGIFLGLFGAGLAIALQQPILSIVGWMIILIKQPYVIGDRITVRHIKGDVIDISLFYTKLREVGGGVDGDDPSGVLVTVPNSLTLSEPILNYTKEFEYVWDEVPLSLTYESDIEVAKKIVLDSASRVLGDSMKKAVAEIKPHLKNTLQEVALIDKPVVYVSFKDSWVELRVKYVTHVTSKRLVKSDITYSILKEFNDEKNKNLVEIAYPHTEVVLRDRYPVNKK